MRAIRKASEIPKTMNREDSTKGQGFAELRIKNIPPGIHEGLQNVASNLGISVSALIKQKLPEILESFPEIYRSQEPNP